MSTNTLFNFIDLHILSLDLGAIHCNKLELDKNKDGHLYYRCELNQSTKPVILKNGNEIYTLSEHHISIYQIEQRNNPSLSQYHYTAYFTDSKGMVFRLHVYFNDNDELTMNTVFSRKEQGSFIPVKTEDLESKFIELAVTSVKPVISALRKNHNNQISTLERRYIQLEKEAKALFGKKEKDTEYLAKLNAICVTLKALIPLVRKSPYQQIYRFITRTKASMQARIIEETTTPANEPPKQQTLVAASIPAAEEKAPLITENHTFLSMVAEEASLALDSPNAETSAKFNSEKKTPSERKTFAAKPQKPKKYDRALKRLHLAFEQLQTSDTTAQAKNIENLLAQTYEFLLLFEEKETLSFEVIQEIDNLRRNIHLLGESLLVSLLFEKKFTLAAQLPSFHHLLTDKYLNLALQTRNHELLDFVLTHGDFNLNSQPVTLKVKTAVMQEITYSSAITACISRDSGASPMVHCLSVLLKHGASLCVQGENGLPLAYTIMTTDNHPLQQALINNRNNTIDSVKFFKELRGALISYLKQGNANAIEYEAISREIENYDARIKILLCPELQTTEGKKLQQRFDYFEEKHFGNLKRQLKEDPEISFLSSQLEAVSKSLMTQSKQPGTQLFLRKTAKAVNVLDQLLDELGIKFEFEDLKPVVIDALKGKILLHTKIRELQTVQAELHSHPVIRKPSRRQKENLRLEQVLLKEIKELQEKYEITHQVDKLQESVAGLADLTAELNRLEKLQESLTSLSTFFKSLTKDTKALGEIESDSKQQKSPAQLLSSFSSLFETLTLDKEDEQEKENKTGKEDTADKGDVETASFT
ncbi:hypothetical protein [Legionella cardiaca]|uniref:Coiled-coil-containing protein n=1 Tax=Legionella cardiaca TaxID=1071983 RepID=A0ABY8AVM7_9GAMM|nr:hypothetical protein [Legionella cardiaca]WED44533.1 hypothetical protein PXX05_07030 [Legionella cardiaca]